MIVVKFHFHCKTSCRLRKIFDCYSFSILCLNHLSHVKQKNLFHVDLMFELINNVEFFCFEHYLKLQQSTSLIREFSIRTKRHVFLLLFWTRFCFVTWFNSTFLQHSKNYFFRHLNLNFHFRRWKSEYWVLRMFAILFFEYCVELFWRRRCLTRYIHTNTFISKNCSIVVFCQRFKRKCLYCETFQNNEFVSNRFVMNMNAEDEF